MIIPGSITTIEAIRREDSRYGATIWQLTSATAIHTNIYLETPFMDAASRYVLFTRSRDSWGPVEVWRADLEQQWLTPVCEGANGITGMAVSPDQRFFYCVRQSSSREFELLRTEITTLEQQSLHFAGEPCPLFDVLGSVSPDGRAYLAGAALPAGGFGILRIDLETGDRRIIHQGPELCNPHPQFEPGQGLDILIQHNRGCEFAAEGRCLRLVGEQGATLYLINSEGGSHRPLLVGKPYTLPVMGHQCWIGSTGEVLLTVTCGTREEMAVEGNLLAARAGAPARIVARGHVYNHPNSSRDGRFFVCDTIEPGCPLVVGSIRTGKTRGLCESQASTGAPQYTHAHPYFSPDSRWVIFNSDRTGIPHVYALPMPPGLLDELDE